MATPSLRLTGETSSPESARARTVGAVVGGVAVAGVFAKLGLTGEAVVSAFLLGVLVALAVIDVEEGVLPNRIILPAFAAVLLGRVATEPDKGLEWILAAVGTALLLLIPAAVRRGTIGMGDVKLGLLLGAGLGLDVMQALLLGLLAAWPVVGYLVLRDGRPATAMTLPLAPFLALGAIAAVFLD